MEYDLDILAGGVEDLDHRLIRHQLEKRREIDVRRERIDERGHARSRHLDQAEFRPECRFANELGVDGDERRFRKRADNRFKFLLRGDEVHWAFLGNETRFVCPGG